jgi:hypothetical protein
LRLCRLRPGVSFVALFRSEKWGISSILMVSA